jgi:hypothetical protein
LLFAFSCAIKTNRINSVLAQKSGLTHHLYLTLNF